MKKICPFMSTAVITDSSSGAATIPDDTLQYIRCCEKDCMAWGVIWKAMLLIEEDKYGCKLIESSIK